LTVTMPSAPIAAMASSSESTEPRLPLQGRIMQHDIWFYGGSVATSFLTVFLRVLQHKNVVGNHYKLAFMNSWLMACAEVLTISLIVKGGWVIAFTSGMGGSFGVILSMWLHNRLFKTH
jgi:hypothetical protein